jgi:hypothetical protein
MPPKIPDLGKIKQIIPPLSSEMHKGQAGMSILRECLKIMKESSTESLFAIGRIGIVGGSEE